MELTNLEGKDYVINFSAEEFDAGYKAAAELINQLRNNFPGKNFYGLYKGVTVKELDDKEVLDFKEIIDSIVEERGLKKD